MVAYPALQGKAGSYGGGNPPMAEEGVWGGAGTVAQPERLLPDCRRCHPVVVSRAQILPCT